MMIYLRCLINASDVRGIFSMQIHQPLQSNGLSNQSFFSYRAEDFPVLELDLKHRLLQFVF